jgi:hypothetical protein
MKISEVLIYLLLYNVKNKKYNILNTIKNEKYNIIKKL